MFRSPESRPISRRPSSPPDSLYCRHGRRLGRPAEVIDEADEDGPSRGASTITMQTAKNVFLWPGRSAIRKGLEIPLALFIDFLGQAPRHGDLFQHRRMGRRALRRGGGRAHYFHKSAKAEPAGGRPARLGAAQSASARSRPSDAQSGRRAGSLRRGSRTRMRTAWISGWKEDWPRPIRPEPSNRMQTRGTAFSRIVSWRGLSFALSALKSARQASKWT